MSRLESKPSGWVGSRTLVDYLLKISKIEYRKEPEALLGYKGRVLTKPALSEALITSYPDDHGC